MPQDKAIKPHPVLTDYYTDETARRARVDRMFDDSAREYDRINRLMSFGSDRWYRKQALLRAGMCAGQKVCDVGAGTGVVSLLAQEIVGESGYVVAVDPSRGMLEVARENGVRNIHQSLGEELPFEDDMFDMVTMGFALRHVSDLRVLFQEYKRVLKPGGKILLLEITKPEGRLSRFFLKTYMNGWVPAATRLFGGSAESRELFRYYWDTIEQCVPPATILSAIEDAGLIEARRDVEQGIFSEYSALKPG